MSRFVKQLITEELKQRYDGVESACVVEITGMDVLSTEKLRQGLRQKSARLELVKNSMARRAFADGPLSTLGEALTGPSALVTSPDSIIEVAKYLVSAAKEFKALKLKQAVIDGDPSVMDVIEVAKLRSRDEVLGEVLMLITSPARSVAGCLAGPQAKLAGCLKAIADKEEGESAEAA